MALGSRNISLNKDELINVSSIYQTLHEVSKWSTYPSIDKIKEQAEINGVKNIKKLSKKEKAERLSKIKQNLEICRRAKTKIIALSETNNGKNISNFLISLLVKGINNRSKCFS